MPDEAMCSPEMVSIPPGTFQMGDHFNEGRFYERPVRTITLSAFLMSRYIITNRQYADFLNAAMADGTIYVSRGAVYGRGNNRLYCETTLSSIRSNITYENGRFGVRRKAGRDLADDPMVRVSWYGAAAWCNWRSRVEQRQPVYDLSTSDYDFSKNGYPLAATIIYFYWW